MLTWQAADMTIEAALVKLMYLAGSLGSPEATRSALPEPIAGEISAHDSAVGDGVGPAE